MGRCGSGGVKGHIKQGGPPCKTDVYYFTFYKVKCQLLNLELLECNGHESVFGTVSTVTMSNLIIDAFLTEESTAG